MKVTPEEGVCSELRNLIKAVFLIIHQSPFAALDPDSRACHIRAKASYSCCLPLKTQREWIFY